MNFIRILRAMSFSRSEIKQKISVKFIINGGISYEIY